MSIPIDDVSEYLAGDPELAREIEQMMSQREAAADQIIRQAHPESTNGVLMDDRVKLIEEMFQS